MTHEKQLQTTPNIDPTFVPLSGHEALEESPLSSLGILNGLEQLGIPINDKEGIATSLDTLRIEFGIEDSFLEKPKGALVMSAIADKYNRILKNETIGQTAKIAELDYVADLIMSSAGSQTKFKDDYKAAMESKGVSDEQSKAAYDKYTQREVTAEMDAYIRGPKFDELRKRLGVTEEEPFEVRVLSIDDENGSLSSGLAPRLDYPEPYDRDAWNALEKEKEYRGDYFKALKKNGKDFNESLGREGIFAPAWVTQFDDGTKYLCLSLPTAEKVLYEGEERAPYYNDDSIAHDIAIVEHEYTHTQKGLMFDNHIGVGISLEELRAEHFSGDKHGYIDIKKYFTGIGMLTGYSPKKSFEHDEQPYDEGVFLTRIATNLGLDGLLDCLAAIPQNYAEDEHVNPYTKAIVAHNGGSLSAQFQTAYEMYKAKLGDAVVEANISTSIDKMYEYIKDKGISVESWLSYGRITSLQNIGIENFRRRHPDASDGYDYVNHKMIETAP